MTTDPPHWLSWASDIAGVIGLLALACVPLYKRLSPALQNWQARRSHSAQVRQLKYFQKRLEYIQGLEEHPTRAVLIILRHILQALFYVLLPFTVQGVAELVWPKAHTTPVDGFRIGSFCGALLEIFIAQGSVDFAIDPSFYKRQALNIICELKTFDTQKKDVS